jgi:hypothetical protein
MLMRHLIAVLVASIFFAAHAGGTAHGFVYFGDPLPLNPDAATDSGSKDDSNVYLATDGVGNWVAAWSGTYISTSADNGLTWTTPQLLTPTSEQGFFFAEPAVVTDRAGTWIVVWGSRDTLGGTIGNDVDVFYSVSIDNGATWTPGALLNSDAATDDGNDERPRLATDEAGNWMAVWTSRNTLGGTVGDDRDIFMVRSSNGGATWTAPTAINFPAFADDLDDSWPAVATDGAGTWVVVYNQFLGTTGVLRTLRSTDFGFSWSAPKTINTTLGDALAAIAAGGTDLFITTHTNLNTNINRSTDGGENWTGRPVSGSIAGTQGRAQIATDGAGGWVVVWSTRIDPDGSIGEDWDIGITRSDDDGVRWTSPALLNTNAFTDPFFADDQRPFIATDRAGTWIGAWRSNNDFDNSIGGDDDLIMARSEGLCPFSRRNDCIGTTAPGKGKVGIADSYIDPKDKVKFKLSKGGATDLADFGDPTTTGDLVFCAYDATADVDQLVWQIPLPAGTTCDDAPCWKATSKGFSYKDKLLDNSAFGKAKLTAGAAGKTKILVSGKGLSLGTPPIPFANDTSLAVQVISLATNQCWGASFSAPKKNDFEKYVGKSD